MSAAKIAGGLISLYPDGDVRQCPWYLNQAITQALTVLGFMEMREEDQPKEEIWLDPEELNHHFNRVRAKWGGGDDDWEDVDMTENEIAKEMRRRVS